MVGACNHNNQEVKVTFSAQEAEALEVLVEEVEIVLWGLRRLQPCNKPYLDSPFF